MATKKAATARSTATPAPQRQEPDRAEPRRQSAPPGDRTPVRRRSPAPDPIPGERTLLSVSEELAAGSTLREKLRSRVIGQDQVLEALSGAWARLLAGLRDPERPLLTALLLGPTGVGKTETARALAEALFGSPRALVRVDCEEYSQGHEVARLLGSPPGYVGADIEPLLSQKRVDQAHGRLRLARARQHPASAEEALADRNARSTPDGLGEADHVPDPELATVEALIDQVHDPEDGLHSILLFDEIEKAHPTLWNTLLGVLEDGRVTLGNNRTTDLRRSIILMTSNAGSREMNEALGRRRLGFAAQAATPDATTLREIAHEAARGMFPAEFLNRFDEVLVFAPLDRDALSEIFDKFLDLVTERALRRADVPLLLRVSDAARRTVIDAGTDPALGARPLRRAMERLLVDPLSRLLATGQLCDGDVVDVELEEGKLAFYRLPRSDDAIVA